MEINIQAILKSLEDFDDGEFRDIQEFIDELQGIVAE
jgi:hypothetical protein